MNKHWSMASALEQIASCAFECEAGPLANNVAFKWLVGAAKVGPEFWPGQGVYYEVKSTVSGVPMSKWAHFYIVGCHMSSDETDRFWEYALSNDPPGPWHFGTVNFRGVPGRDLHLDIPQEVN